MFRKLSQELDFLPSVNSDKAMRWRVCEHEGCEDEGGYRAPKSRHHLESEVDDWHWFCLIHIRDYNARWNYYANMSESEIERERRADMTWQRPSWPLGADKGTTYRAQSSASLQDPFDLFKSGFSSSHCEARPRFASQSAEGKALLLLGLSSHFTQNELRKRYRELVKKHHPDANGGCLKAEETLKRINEAYEVLKNLP